jgi:rhodanese-related sulfurtransferase
MKKEKTLTSEELKAKIDNHEDFILVDVLPHSDYARTHIQGAINIPLEELETKANQWLSHQIDIIIYSAGPRCRGGEFAQEYLAAHGFRAWRLHEGLEEWARKLYPLEGDPNYKPHDIVMNPLAPKPPKTETKPPQPGITPPPVLVKPGNIVQKLTPKPPEQQRQPVPKKKAA